MSRNKGYLGVAALGALGGGVAVALGTRAIPTLLTQIKSAMMRKMMAGMGESGCDPAEMCRRMMAGSGEAQTEEGSQGSDTPPECAAATSSGCECGATATAGAVTDS